LAEFIFRLKLALRFFFPKKPCAVFGNSVSFDFRSEVNNLSNNPEMIKIGDGTRIDGILMVWKKQGEIIIGRNTYIGLGSRVWSAKKITIGNNVQLAHNVNIFDSNIHSLDPSIRLIEYLNHYENVNSDLKEQEVIIEDNVWLGTNVVILKGVSVGKNSIVGAGTIITKDIPPNCIVAGNPPKIIRTIEVI
jgi:acetyltransferase-like isoleucine patch superfamily enzyme